MKKIMPICVLFLLLLFISPEIFAQPKLWGTLPHAGKPGAGLVYEFNLNGYEWSDVYAFEKFEGEDPQHQVLLADNNLFYGIADGGYGQFGSFIYSYDPITNEFNIVHDFYDPSTTYTYRANDGFLMQASDGLIYGFNQNGGLTGDGQIFLLKPESNEVQYLAEFEALSTGTSPVGGLTEASDGKLYGVTSDGGFCNFGTIFSYDPETDQLVMERCFESANGVSPQNSLMLASNGILYGLTYAGGGNGDGVMYSYEPGTGIYTMLNEFNTSGHGGKPYGRLFQASDEKLYGTTSTGGANGDGIIFSYDLNLDLFAVKINFDGTNGAYPNGSLIEYEGHLYGMTTEGGVADEGILFQYDHLSNTITKRADCYGVDYGRYPYGTLSIGPDGKLYGQTYLGGKNNKGIMFDYNTSTLAFTKRFDFGEAADGALNYGSLVLGSDGWVYGTSSEGGQDHYGTIYRINPVDREFQSLYDFDMTYGSSPLSGLMQATDGYFYGTTPFGGSAGWGVIYRFHQNSNLVSVLEDMITPSQGQTPSGTPVQASDGFLYGLTSYGGSIGDGALYKFNLGTNIYSKLADFQDAATGSFPLGSLVEASNGRLYAMAKHGGQFAKGTLFEYDPVSTSFSVVVHFDGLNKGETPTGSLLNFDGHKLYGMCREGGVYNGGTIFVYDTESMVCTKLYDFNPSDGGSIPYSYLMKASDNKIYGTTQEGGSYNSGVLFQLDPGTDEYKDLHEFTTFREYPWLAALIEVDTDFGVSETGQEELQFRIYPNPVHDVLNITTDVEISSVFNIRVVNQLGQGVMETSALLDKQTPIAINVSDLEEGIYFIQLTTKGQSITKKFLKTE